MAAVHARWFFLAIIACSSGSHVESVAPRASTCGAPLPAGASKSARQQLQTAHGNAVTQMAESADGYLATTSQFDHTIRIWNLQQSTLVTVLQGTRPSPGTTTRTRSYYRGSASAPRMANSSRPISSSPRMATPLAVASVNGPSCTKPGGRVQR